MSNALRRSSPVEIVGNIENSPAAEVVVATPATGDPGLVVYQEGFGTTVVPVFITGGGSPGGTASTFGAVFPSLGTAAGALDTNGNMAALNLDSSGNLKVTGGSGGGDVTIISPLDGSGFVEVSVKNASIAVTGTFFQATQPISGAISFTAPQHTIVDSGAVTVSGTVAFSNATIAVTNTGTFSVQAAVTEADGANVTLGAKADAKSTATDTTPITIMSVLKEISFMEQNPASRAVTNAGTFAVQSTLSAETTKVIGTVNQGTSPWVTSFSSPQHVVVDSGAIVVTNAGTFAVQEATLDATIVAQGTSASSKIVIVGGKTNDGTPQYREIPEGAGGRSIIIEGFGGGTAVPISGAVSFTAPQHVILDSGTVTFANTTIAVTNTGTFAVQAAITAASGSISSGALAAGSIASGAAVAGSFADGALVTLGAKADAKSTATDTTAITIMQVLKEISFMEQTPASRAVTNAGTFAVQATEADGANVTLGAKADAKSTATDTTPISIMSVLKQVSASVQAPPSQAVTNAGTFAVQEATLDGAISGGKVKVSAAAGDVVVEISDGSNIIGTSGHPVRVDATGTTTQPVSETAGVKATYSCAAEIIPTASGHMVQIFGSGTKTVKITRVAVNIETTGTSAQIYAGLYKWPTPGTTGTAVTQPIVPHDSAFAAATAVVKTYVGTVTGGSGSNSFRGQRLENTKEGGATSNTPTGLEWRFGDDLVTSSIVLRGTGESVTIALSGVSVTQVLDFTIEWTEE